MLEKTWKYFAIIIFALSTPILAQTLVMEKEYEIGKPITISVGDVPSVPDTVLTTLWEVQNAEKREFGNVLAVWASNNTDGTPKTVYIDCITRLTKKVVIEGTEYELEIPGTFKRLKGSFNVVGFKQPSPPPGPGPTPPLPPGPTPPPTPNPTVPDDAFGNIGRAVSGWISQVAEPSRSKRTELAAMYLSVANMALTVKIEDVNKILQSERTRILNTPQLNADWADVGAKISADIASRTFNDRIALSAYYKALHNGFK